MRDKKQNDIFSNADFDSLIRLFRVVEGRDLSTLSFIIILNG